MNSTIECFQGHCAKMPEGPVMVHSDLFRASTFVPKTTNRDDLLASHVAFLEKTFVGRPLVYPVFNYDFCNSNTINLATAPSQVGPLGEYVRDQTGWRSFDPIFSVTSKQPQILSDEVNGSTKNAFGTGSIFAKLDSLNGSVCFYGSSFDSATVIHYIEELAGKPLYRYEKKFCGDIVDIEGKSHVIEYYYPVRPKGKYFGYDWKKLQKDASKEGILYEQKEYSLNCSLHDLKLFWLYKLKNDPFYLLDEKSREWVIPLVDNLGRRFEQEDFE